MGSSELRKLISEKESEEARFLRLTKRAISKILKEKGAVQTKGDWGSQTVFFIKEFKIYVEANPLYEYASAFKWDSKKKKTVGCIRDYHSNNLKEVKAFIKLLEA